MANIELQNIAHQYGSGQNSPGQNSPDENIPYALKNMNELWQDGGAYALLGPSGCGKTTLLNIISGLLQPSEGRVLFDGLDVTGLSPEQRNIAQVFQFPVVYDTLTVAQNLAFPLRNRKLPKQQIEARVAEVLKLLGMTDRAGQRAHSLSADDKQKISLGRGLVRTDVNAILFDEPLTVIDPHLKWQLRTELKKIHQQFQHTMIYVTHDQTEALTFADKVIVMYEGAVVQIGTPQELFEHPAHTFVGKFIGSPGMNVMQVDLHGTSARLGDAEIQLPKSYESAVSEEEGAASSGFKQKVELGIRPEHLSLLPTGPDELRADIVGIEDVGKHIVVRAKVQGQGIDVIVKEGVGIPESPYLSLTPEKLNVYQNSYLVQGQPR
jgi:glycerol transport system ATP-binding protein